jgi:hypothetical protein
MDLLGELQEIHDKVAADPKNVDKQLKKRYWKLVGRIKRMTKVDKPVIVKAAEIRDLLYEHRLGKPRSLKWLVLWLLMAVVSLGYYVWDLIYGGYTGDFMFDVIFVLLNRFGTVMLMIFLLYPFGRLLTGRVLGIKLDGITRDIYYLPTLKINYISYLEALPPRRMLFFFFSGYWTTFTAIWVGAIGVILGGDWIGIIIAVILGLLEALGAVVGGYWGGELGHFHRERRIVRDWKRSLES